MQGWERAGQQPGVHRAQESSNNETHDKAAALMDTYMRHVLYLMAFIPLNLKNFILDLEPTSYSREETELPNCMKFTLI